MAVSRRRREQAHHCRCIGERLLDRDIAITVVFLKLWPTAYVRARFMSTRFMQAVFQIVLGGSIVLYLLVDPHVRFWH
jgi:hypothetical protein